MRIDAHCHVFTFASFLTAAAETNLKARLKSRHLSDAACHDIVAFAKNVLFGPAAEARLAALASRLGLVGHPVLEFLRRGCRPSISEVTDALMADTKAAAAPDAEYMAVALMMDVVDGESTQADTQRFASQYTDPVYPDKPCAGQYHDTVLQALRYPGRLLPFVAVNPLRGDEALRMMHHALDSGECVGVKLYPSLGYGIDNPMVEKIMQECVAYNAPITMHCNDGGFCGAAQHDYFYCSPVSWRDVIKDYDVRFNFAHFGDQTPGKPGFDVSWRDIIIEAMDHWPKRVFADVSYQSGPLGDSAAQDAYVAWLAAQMATARGRNILFGTDSFMLLQVAWAVDYWGFFKTRLGADFSRLACANAARFLGFQWDGDDCPPTDAAWTVVADSSLERPALYLRDRQADPAFGTGAPPADWLKRCWAAFRAPSPTGS